MSFKKSPSAIQHKNAKNIANSKEYPTLADLIREQNTSINEAKAVHYRRDLDSLG